MIKKISKFSTIFITLAILYIPILIICFLSVNDSLRPYEFNGFTLKWYLQIFKEKTLYQAILNTWGIALLATAISTVCGTFIALAISSLKQKHRQLVIFLNNMPILNADIVTGISLMIVFSFLGLHFGRYTMLLAHIFFCIPFVVLSIMPRLKMMDENSYDAARDLGCTHFQAVRKVILPAIKVGIISGALIAFTMSIDDFIISYYTTGDGFSNFSTWIYSRLNRRTFSPAAYAYNTIITLGLLITLIYINLKGDSKNEKNN
ncbi:spermidine/putrescine transport system permease protein [Bacilli bacterium PM5-9]|nr:spermidine/putrescine transport system permease protein [Bacilli bacterium PM5-9]